MLHRGMVASYHFKARSTIICPQRIYWFLVKRSNRVKLQHAYLNLMLGVDRWMFGLAFLSISWLLSISSQLDSFCVCFWLEQCLTVLKLIDDLTGLYDVLLYIYIYTFFPTMVLYTYCDKLEIPPPASTNLLVTAWKWFRFSMSLFILPPQPSTF
jgi:hypothetical protein